MATAAELFEVHTVFASTMYGERLAANVRYARYNLTGLPNDEWVGLLGADVNNLTHMPLTYGLGRAFLGESARIAPGQFGQEDGERLQTSFLIHDQGESIIGDITYGSKTDEDEIGEHEALRNHAEAFSPGLSEDQRARIAKARDEIVFDTNRFTVLGKAFNAVECIGYLRTALRANSVISSGKRPDLDVGLRWLVVDVLGNGITGKLADHSVIFPAITTYLAAVKEGVTNAFVQNDDARNFAPYGDKSQEKYAAFSVQNARWLKLVGGSYPDAA